MVKDVAAFSASLAAQATAVGPLLAVVTLKSGAAPCGANLAIMEAAVLR